MRLTSNLQEMFLKNYVKQIKLKFKNFQGHLHSQVIWG